MDCVIKKRSAPCWMKVPTTRQVEVQQRLNIKRGGTKVPSIGTVTDASAVDLLPEKRELLREPYLDMVKAMIQDKQPRQLKPDEGESLRKLRVNITRAATELGVKVTQRETRDGALYVYLKPVAAPKATAEAPAPSASAESAEAEAEAEAEADA